MDKINIIIDKIKEAFEKINELSILNKTPSKKFIITAFSVLIILIGSLSVVTVISEERDMPTEAADASVSENSYAATTEAPSEELLGNFLLVLTEDGDENIELIALARLDSLNKKVSISFLKDTARSNVNGLDGTMQQHLENGGITELVWAVGEYAGISIERYVIGDEENFIGLMKSLGDIPLNIEKKVSHTHLGIPFIIEKGIQSLSADIMLKYFVYLCENYENIPDKLIETMITYGKKMFDSTDGSVLDKSFNSMIKYFSTDISVVDFTRYKRAVQSLASSETFVEISIETDPSNLK